MNTNEKTVLLFAYGTLMSGFGNNRLIEDQKLIGAGETSEQYTMYGSGIPFVNENEKTSTIKGELWEVTNERLPSVDGLEGHPNWYQRKLIPVIVDGEEHQAWLYFNNDKGGNKIENGDFREFRKKINNSYGSR